LIRCRQASHQLVDVVRRDVRGHAHGDPARPVGQQVRESAPAAPRVRQRAVVIVAEIDGVLVETLQQRLGHRGHPRLGVARGGGVVAVDVAEVALPVHQRVADVEILRQTRHRIVDRRVAMRVVVAHHVAADLRRFPETARRRQPQFAHRIENPPVHRLQPVARIGQRPVHDRRQRISASDVSAADRPARSQRIEDALIETEDGGLVLVTDTGEELRIDRVIEPAALTEEDARVNLPPAESSGALEPDLAGATEEGGAPDIAEAPADPEPPPAEIPATSGTLLRVTGDRVNFRAGPSTDDAILAALSIGTEVELIERVGDGWAHLRVLETDLSGYMSEDFLEPAN
jgi:hypothetical protein